MKFNLTWSKTFLPNLAQKFSQDCWRSIARGIDDNLLEINPFTLRAPSISPLRGASQ